MSANKRWGKKTCFSQCKKLIYHEKKVLLFHSHHCVQVFILSKSFLESCMYNYTVMPKVFT